ncbi:magnesium-translocating P-type ATPase, partial [Cephaloticoccus primus]|uniref:magnesium-translocating P-type ATPase n=1 Tax=Cephaloticoccus primus TaxID=1548207 RepID=UPI0008390A16
ALGRPGGAPRLLVCKGAVEEMLALCTQVELGGELRPFDDESRARLMALRNELNDDGLRVVAVGYKATDKEPGAFNAEDERGLILSGYIAFLDPPKESTAEALRLLREHGVGVKILTGDNALVARKVCRDVGLDVQGVLSGSEVATLDDEALRTAAEQATLFAKLDPAQKARVITALKRNGHTVGFMGDGINDALALREADVGISVDSAVDVAKEAADIILLEKSLLVLERGVLEGRRVFGNIMKYIKMTASSNFGNVFSVLVASAFLPFLPMLAIHLLIQNLLYDFSQLSIPWDRVDADWTRRPRKWSAQGIARFMLWVGPVSSLFDITTFLGLWFIFKANAPEHAALFQSGWFIEGLLTQTLIVHMIRTEKIAFLQSRAAWPVILLTAAVMALGCLVPFTPLGAAVGMVPLPLSYWPFLAATLLGYCLLTQILKRLYLRKFGEWL